MQVARRLPFPSENSARTFTHPKRVFTEISSLLRQSNVHWRGRSFAASVPSDVTKVQKGRKRVSKDERQAMVESFVNKYRATNAGKFPTASDARKQVGGSYYVIKKILQEIEYNSTICSMNTRNDSGLGKEVAKVKKTSTKVEEVSGTRLKWDARVKKVVQTVAGYDVDISGPKNVVAEEGPETSTSLGERMTEEVVKYKTKDEFSTYTEKRKHISEGESEVDICRCPEMPEHDVKDSSRIDGPKPESEQHLWSSESDEFARDLSAKKIDEEEHTKKSSVWGNLKSLADGFINMWKKM